MTGTEGQGQRDRDRGTGTEGQQWGNGKGGPEMVLEG